MSKPNAMIVENFEENRSRVNLRLLNLCELATKIAEYGMVNGTNEARQFIDYDAIMKR